MYTTIEHLANRWAAADKQILRHVFPLLAEGRPIQIEQIAEKAGTSVTRVEKALTEGRASLDAAGRVIELSGLMLPPSLHRVEVDGVALFSCCALLAHMTPFLLGRDVKLESVELMRFDGANWRFEDTVELGNGVGLAIDGNRAVIGDSDDDTAGLNTGKVTMIEANDSDGDGLLDCWETAGIPIPNGPGTYMLPGADPMRKDLYVELDAMAGNQPSD